MILLPFTKLIQNLHSADKFSGMSQEDGISPSLTIMRASKSVTVLELDHPLITFAPLNVSPYSNASQQPFGIAVLMKYDLHIIDLTIPG